MDDTSTLVGIISLVLSLPLGVCSIFAFNWLMRELALCRLIRANETRQLAIRTYESYAYNLLSVGWAGVCVVVSGTATILVVLIDPEMNIIPPSAPAMILLLIAAASVVIALMLIFNLYDDERKLEKIDAAHREDQHKSRDGQQLQ